MLGNLFKKQPHYFISVDVEELSNELSNYLPLSKKIEYREANKKKQIYPYELALSFSTSNINASLIILIDKLWGVSYDHIELETAIDAYSNISETTANLPEYILKYLDLRKRIGIQEKKSWIFRISSSLLKHCSLSFGVTDSSLSRSLKTEEYETWISIHTTSKDVKELSTMFFSELFYKLDFVGDVHIHIAKPPISANYCPYEKKLNEIVKKQRPDVQRVPIQLFGFSFQWLTMVPAPGRRHRNKIDAQGNTIKDEGGYLAVQEPYNPFVNEEILLNAPVYKVKQLKNGWIIWQLTETLDPMSDSEEYARAWIKLYDYLVSNMSSEPRQ